MTRILGIDPGATTGWCLYDTATRAVVSCGHSRDFDVLTEAPFDEAGAIVIERPKGYGPTRPQMVDCGYVAGYLFAAIERESSAAVICEMTRLEVCQSLTAATHGQVNVRSDATAWAALVLLHGEGSDRKPKRKAGKIIDEGGPLGRVTGHARAALAVAVAYVLRQVMPAGEAL